jgi:hypothetical protein
LSPDQIDSSLVSYTTNTPLPALLPELQSSRQNVGGDLVRDLGGPPGPPQLPQALVSKVQLRVPLEQPKSLQDWPAGSMPSHSSEPCCMSLPYTGGSPYTR